MAVAVIGLVIGLLLALGAWVHRQGQVGHALPPRALPVIVLGARVRADSSPTPALVDRVGCAVALLNQGVARELIVSGGSPDARRSEAEVMRQLAQAQGHRPTLLEQSSRSTYENARECAHLLTMREVLLVTCDFHLLRASAHFRARGFTVWPVASKRTLTKLARVKVTAFEVLALVRRPWLLWYAR